MRIASKSARNFHEAPRNGHAVMAGNFAWKIGIQLDCTSEPFTKPELCAKMINRITFTLGSKKKSITLNSSKRIITCIAVQLDRVTTKVFGQSQAYNVMDDLSLEECEVFIIKWSKELKTLRSKHRDHFDKKFKWNLECLNNKEDHMQKLTEAQKDLLWFVHILKLLPKSSVCQEECVSNELLNLYRRWKKGQLISMLPIMSFIMEILLNKKDSVLKQRLQVQHEWKQARDHKNAVL